MRCQPCAAQVARYHTVTLNETDFLTRLFFPREGGPLRCSVRRVHNSGSATTSTASGSGSLTIQLMKVGSDEILTTEANRFCSLPGNHADQQGKLSPGAHIPIRPYEDFKTRYPDYALLFGWNHAEEIMAKEQALKAAGGKWIVYVPKVQVLG
ncbi:MAG: hypothetical protein HYY65_04440 [Candidatus Tectomicrobia bacterium]|uniref:C-methyltransferase domain-containing protein n=1 Tax=Tectimicrobiota bacterium TaxID=2528274 RepID=A0A932GNC1_UNCTE|nr:hypothetical protein [Candidatus Tectomicrobia bacterium]